MTMTEAELETPEAKIRRKAARLIHLAIQFEEFGHRDTLTGDWTCTGAQIDALSDACNRAAAAIIPIVQAAERERCAKLAENARPSYPQSERGYENHEMGTAIAAAIRHPSAPEFTQEDRIDTKRDQE